MAGAQSDPSAEALFLLTRATLEADRLQVLARRTSAEGSADALVNGTPEPDSLTGTAGDDEINGLGGNDVIDGLGGSDVLRGGLGDDTYFVDVAGDVVVEAAGEGFDQVYAFANYALTAGSSVEVLGTANAASTAALILTGNEFGQQIFGNAGANALTGGGGQDALYGGGGDDFYFVEGDDVLVEAANGGFDQAYSSTGITLTAGAAIEVLAVNDYSATNALTIIGNELGQQIFGNAGANILVSGGGQDALYGNGGDDIYLIDGDDHLVEAAGGGFDQAYSSTHIILTAGAAIEVLGASDSGSTAALNLTGNEYGQQIFGNAGANVLDGGGGVDVLYGRGGKDAFAFTTVLGAGNIDFIADFDSGDDVFLLGGNSGEAFAALGSGALHSNAFRLGSAALDGDDLIIYDQATGALYYDADGNGAGAAVQFASLAAGTVVTIDDFVISGPENHRPSLISGATASVAENSPASTIVYQAVATDLDGDRLSYALSGADAHLFTVDAQGAVRLVSPANYEAKATYSFNVTASDAALRSAVLPVTLTITNVAEGSTPIISEAQTPHNSINSAQNIDRTPFQDAVNPNLPDDGLPSATIQGALLSNSERDFYSIFLQAGERLILDVDGTAGGLDSFLQVFGANGVLIVENDDQGAFDPGSVGIATTHNTDSFISFRAASGEHLFFSIGSFEQGTSGSYKINVSIGPPATQAQIIEEDIQAMLSGDQWSTLNLTYSFPNSSSDYAQGFGEGNDDGPEPASFSPFTATQQAAVQAMLPYIASLTNLTFQQLFDPNDGAAKLRYAMTNATGAAHAYYPGNYDEAGQPLVQQDRFQRSREGQLCLGRHASRDRARARPQAWS